MHKAIAVFAGFLLDFQEGLHTGRGRSIDFREDLISGKT
jgi:hypothetical protein